MGKICGVEVGDGMFVWSEENLVVEWDGHEWCVKGGNTSYGC